LILSAELSLLLRAESVLDASTGSRWSINAAFTTGKLCSYNRSWEFRIVA